MTVPTLTSAPLPGAPGVSAIGEATGAGTPEQGFGAVLRAVLGRPEAQKAHPEATGPLTAECCAEAGTSASTDPAGLAGTGVVSQDGGTEEPAEAVVPTAGNGDQPASAVQPPAGTPVAVAAVAAVATAPDVAPTVEPPVRTTGGTDAAPASGPPGSDSPTAPSPAPAGASGQVVEPTAADTAHPAGATAAGATAAGADTSQGTAGPATTGLTAVAGASPATAASTTAATGSTDSASPVTGQVFPEVTRLVTRGDGTQRLTLRLNPDNLGEVRIVVTVRDGAVDVSLAAGTEAQEALRHGSPELRRLLESVGAVSTQIAVRDLPTATTSAGQPAGTGATHLDGSGTDGQGRQDRTDEQHRRKTPAGNDAAGPSATHPRVPTHQASASGVDLRL